jgi:ligand-binding sensor domain-containing protein
MAWPGLSQGQSLAGFFRNFGPDQGWPTGRVYALAQDRAGFLWAGTNQGLVRYDGHMFRVFLPQPDDSTTLRGSNIQALLADPDGGLWVGTYENGLQLLDPVTGQELAHFGDGGPSLGCSRVTHLALSPNGQDIYVGCHQLYWRVLHRATRQMRQVALRPAPGQPPLPEKNSVYGFWAPPGQDSLVWVATNDGLLRWNRQTGHYHLYQPKAADGTRLESKLRGIVPTRDGALWLATRGGGLLRFWPPTSAWEAFAYASPPLNRPANLVVGLLAKTDREMWLATLDSGLGVFNLEQKRFRFFRPNPEDPAAIGRGEVLSLLTDVQGTLWAGRQGGVSQHTPGHQHFPLVVLPVGPAAVASGPSEFALSADGQTLYTGSFTGPGIWAYHRPTGRLRLLRPATWPPDRPLALARMRVDSTGRLWAVSYKALLRYDPATDRLEELSLPPAMQPATLHFHSLELDGPHACWLGTRYHGLFRVDLASQTFRHYQHDPQNPHSLVHDRYLHDLRRDGQGRLWVATERGLSILDPAQRRFTNFGQAQGYRVIYRLAPDGRGQMWATTENNGALAFDLATLQPGRRLTEAQGLPTNQVQHISAGPGGTVWIATQKGLCRYDPASGQVLVLDTRNGLPDQHCEQATLALPDGWVAQGYPQGFTLFNAADLPSRLPNFKPVITGFQVFGEPFALPVDKGIQLSHQQNFFGFEFSALDLANPDQVRYQHQLVGVDPGWVNDGPRHQASYTDVAGGQYEFRVRAVQGNGAWPSHYRSIAVSVSPPFWQRWWFLALLATGLAGVVYVLYRWRLGQVRREAMLKTELTKQLASLEIKALRGQMNPHFLFNSLNSIKYYILQNEADKASAYLNQFAKLIRRILNNTEQEFIYLEDEVETLRLYLEMESLRFGEKMRYHIVVDPSVDLLDVQVPSMLIQPYVENAIWHGLMHRPEGGRLELAVRPAGVGYVFTVQDNGVGRAQAAALKSKTAISHKSLGMNITAARIDILNQAFGAGLKVLVHDLTEPNGQPAGTRVEIYFNGRGPAA